MRQFSRGSRRFVTSVPARTGSYQLVPDDRHCLPIRFRRLESGWYAGTYQETGWYRIAAPLERLGMLSVCITFHVPNLYAQSEALITRDDATTRRAARARPGSRASDLLLSVDAPFAQNAPVSASMDA